MFKYPILCLCVILSLFTGMMLGQNDYTNIDDNLLSEYHELNVEYVKVKNLVENGNELLQILSEIDAKDYNKETNNCYDQSKELVNKLRDGGYYAVVAINSGRGHAFSLVGIESTNGSFQVLGNNTIIELRDGNGKLIK